MVDAFRTLVLATLLGATACPELAQPPPPARSAPVPPVRITRDAAPPAAPARPPTSAAAPVRPLTIPSVTITHGPALPATAAPPVTAPAPPLAIAAPPGTSFTPPPPAPATPRAAPPSAPPAPRPPVTDLGPTWTIDETVPWRTPLFGLWSAGVGELYAVGMGGTVLHLAAGAIWTRRPTEVASHL